MNLGLKGQDGHGEPHPTIQDKCNYLGLKVGLTI